MVQVGNQHVRNFFPLSLIFLALTKAFFTSCHRFVKKARFLILSTASGALVVGGVRDIYIMMYPEITFERLKLDQTRPDQTSCSPVLSTLDYPSYIFSVSFVFLNSLLFCVISTVQCTMCCLYSMFSFQPNKVRLTLTFLF